MVLHCSSDRNSADCASESASSATASHVERRRALSAVARPPRCSTDDHPLGSPRRREQRLRRRREVEIAPRFTISRRSPSRSPRYAAPERAVAKHGAIRRRASGARQHGSLAPQTPADRDAARRPSACVSRSFRSSLQRLNVVSSTGEGSARRTSGSARWETARGTRAGRSAIASRSSFAMIGEEQERRRRGELLALKQHRRRRTEQRQRRQRAMPARRRQLVQPSPERRVRDLIVILEVGHERVRPADRAPACRAAASASAYHWP